VFFKKRKRNISKNPFYNRGEHLVIYFKCEKCNETFRSHLRKYYDIAVDYGKGGSMYSLQKEYIGSECHNRIQITAVFNRAFRPLTYEITGGSFIAEEDFEQKS
jgi:hypothetical protein